METLLQMNDLKAKFDQLQDSLEQKHFGELLEKRKQALQQFQEHGLPNRKHEEYRYLILSDLSISDFKLASRYSQEDELPVSDFAIPYLDTNLVVFIDGHYSAFHSNILDKHAISVGNLLDMEASVVHDYFANYNFVDYNPFATLNIAFAQEGAYIHVKKSSLVEHPIQLLHINTGNDWVQPNHLVLVDENAQVSLIESHFSLTTTGIDNSFLRIVAKENAIVDHYKIQALGDQAKHFGTTHIEQKRHSNCSTHVYNLGGGLVRNNIHIDIEDDHTEANMYGLYVTDDQEVVDNHTLVNHMKPNCVSNQLYKGVMSGSSTAIFNGKIFVQRNAQVTNAFQSNRNILLSDDASINTKPQLEIWADDVKCSHGATIGKLSSDEIFYLRARGIKEEKAKSMLTYAFAGEVLTYIKIPELRQFLEEGVAAKLGFSM